MKTKLMVVSDSIQAGTGYSEEMKNISLRLSQTGEYEITYVGYQHLGHPLKIEDTQFDDVPNRNGYVTMVSGTGPPEAYGAYGILRNYDDYTPDMVLAIGDPKNFEPLGVVKKQLGFPLIGYVTLDGTPVHPDFQEGFNSMNVPVTMTEWALDEYHKAGMFPHSVGAFIHHGVDWNWLSPSKTLKKRYRNKYLSKFGVNDDTVIFIDWNSNQFRKRTDALLEMWRDFHPERKNAKLFLYCDWDMSTGSSAMGWNLETLIKQLDVPRHTVLSPRDVYGKNRFWEQANSPQFHKELCMLGDVYVSATSGEGFGKCFLEAMSLGIPPIYPEYAALTEVCKKGGIPIPLYKGQAGYYRGRDTERKVKAGIVNQELFIDAMTRLYDHKQEREELGKQARMWAKNFDYDDQIIPAWRDMLGRINPDVIMAEEVFANIS
jgi:glycosyltransferase involved in cell wall biosynthesis